MSEYPVILCCGRFPQSGWERVPRRYRDELFANLLETMQQEKLDKTQPWIGRAVCLQGDDGCSWKFSVAMRGEEMRLEMDAYTKLLNLGFTQAYLDKFPPPFVWHVYTLIQEPIPI